MNPSFKKNLYSILASVFFLVIAAGSSQVNKIRCGEFSLKPNGENNTDHRNFVELFDGTIVYGSEVSMSKGTLFVKDNVKIDNNKYNLKDVKAYFDDGVYNLQHNGNFYRRIVHGKLNLYAHIGLVTVTTVQSNGAIQNRGESECFFFVQNGEDGQLVLLVTKDEIKALVKDCPKAFALADKTNKEIRRAIREDTFYLNNIFTIYNNDCK